IRWLGLPDFPFATRGPRIMDPSHLDELQRTLASKGPKAAIEQLCTVLRSQKDYANLFYALLLKKRHALGVSPVPTEGANELPESVHVPYEEAIREAGRLVGQLYLDEGDIPHAWMYYRMLGERHPWPRRPSRNASRKR